ncbi:unannotated protein [freshwater metagenome]|uniref:Unannotated protein n=1 Tax=freshwater metagenome TaxID=449393 RepID=A0A6J7ND20_9ZZZZ
MSTRPSYKTFVVERSVAAPRAEVWRSLLELVGAAGYAVEGDPAPHGPGATLAFRLGDYDLVEQTLSLEEPWRRCYALTSGAPVALYQGTTTIRDDGPTCLLVWSYLADPGAHEGAVAFLDRAQEALRTATERVARAAEATT